MSEIEPIRSSQDWIRQQMRKTEGEIGPNERIVPVYWIPDEDSYNPFECVEYRAGHKVLVGYNIVPVEARQEAESSHESAIQPWMKLRDNYGF